MLTHIRPYYPRFTCRYRSINVDSSHFWLIYPRPARCPEPLCLQQTLPLAAWHLAPHQKALPLLHRSYGLMRQTKILLSASHCTIPTGPCRLSLVPAGRWPFPTLFPAILAWVLGPLPRHVSSVLLPVSSQGTPASR